MSRVSSRPVPIRIWLASLLVASSALPLFAAEQATKPWPKSARFKKSILAFEAADFRAFAERVHAKLPDTKIVYWSMTPSVKRLANWERESKANELIKAQIAAGENMAYIDATQSTLGSDGKPRPELFTDGLHFNAEAYKIAAKIIRPYLE
ncbi:MAG: hypothetical protein GXY83_36610 [Rhodopirellula sp.]|nr:hypothetical protein [Rhodopirellula sp.]